MGGELIAGLGFWGQTGCSESAAASDFLGFLEPSLLKGVDLDSRASSDGGQRRVTITRCRIIKIYLRCVRAANPARPLQIFLKSTDHLYSRIGRDGFIRCGV